MKALVLFAHPCPESFGAALHTRICDSLAARGWTVDDCDLYAENFQPVLTEEERRAYHDEPANIAPVQAYVDRVRNAEALILSFPVWNIGYPAILKGFFDRVFLPGVSFRLENGAVVPNLTHIRKLAAVTTYGGTRWRAFLAGDPPRKLVKRHLWHVTRPETTRYLALYDMNRATDDRRASFLDQTARAMESL
ncbi:MAG: NAD(P)H-dependent oxidoreductase [Silicimonas sp.]|nr:NAD(P)H-dependent oxidoreductase [Silicimonas sp.]